MTSRHAVPATGRHSRALAELFARTGNPCFCRYWSFPGDKNEWQLECALRPDSNRIALEAELQAGPPPGIVALEGERVLGWMRLAPAEAFAKLYDQRLYRGLPCFSGVRRGVWTLGCLLVEPSVRRQGIARLLLHAGIGHARDRGATHIETFPRHGSDLPDEQLMMGPPKLYAELGFETAHELGPYAVLRLEL